MNPLIKTLVLVQSIALLSACEERTSTITPEMVEAAATHCAAYGGYESFTVYREGDWIRLPNRKVYAKCNNGIEIQKIIKASGRLRDLQPGTQGQRVPTSTKP